MLRTILLYTFFFTGLLCDIYAQTHATTGVEYSQDTRGHLIVPDVGYLQLHKGGELYIGGGYRLLETDRLTITEKVFFVQTIGQLEEGKAQYLQSRTEVNYRFRKRFEGEAVLLPYLPLNKSAHRQLVLEKTKVECELKPFLKAGIGYGAWFSDDRWRHRSFMTTTIIPDKGRFGIFELWYHPLNGLRLQIRVNLK